METNDEFVRLIAKAYYEVALEDMDMHLVVDALEPIRTGMVSRENIFELWLRIDQYIGQISDERILRILLKLRDKFQHNVIKDEIVRLREEFRFNPDSGWNEFLRIYAESMIYFRLNLCVDLSEERFSFPVGKESIVEMIRKSSMCALQGRWPEVYDLILYLADQDIISSRVRAKLYVIAAEIQLFHLYKPEDGVVLLRRAEELDPGGSRVICGFGEYYLQKNELDMAKVRLQEAVRYDPLMAESYIYMGDVFERQNDIIAAEEWYLEAIKRRSGFEEGYIRLLRLYGRPDMFPTHEVKFVPLLNRAIAVNPEGEYDAYLEIGSVYLQNEKFKKAHEWYDRSIRMDHTRMGAYLFKGKAYMAKQKYDRAAASFQKAIDAAPEAMDGHWEMAILYELQREYDKALQLYELCIGCRKSWEGIIRGKIGDIYRELQQPDIAKEELFKGLSSEPENQNLLNSLHALVDDYEVEGKQDVALRILATIREIRGEIYEAEYQNRVGNVKYHFNDYRGATDAYMKAIAVNPMDAEYHSNLSLAYEKMEILDSSGSGLDNAIQAVRRAHELDPGNTDYSTRLDSLGFKKKIISETLDKKMDYSNSLSPVRDCGIEGSTVGFAVAYALEYQILKKLNKKVIISPRYIYYYAKIQGGLNPHEDTGAFIKDAIKVISTQGAVEESVWPYKPGDLQSDPPEVIESAEHYKIRASYPLNNLYEIKASLKIHGPVTAGVTLFPSVFGVEVARSGKIPLPKASEQTIGAIALCIVGYDDEKQVLKFKNHWGEKWGENGYGYLPYEYVVPELLSDAWAISIENT